MAAGGSKKSKDKSKEVQGPNRDGSAGLGPKKGPAQGPNRDGSTIDKNPSGKGPAQGPNRDGSTLDVNPSGKSRPQQGPMQDGSTLDTAPKRNKKPGDEFGKLLGAVVGALVPAPGMGALMAVGDEMGDMVQKNQEDVDAGRKKSTRMDDPAMGRVDDMEGEGISSFGNAASDDRAKNKNGLGGGMTGGKGDGSNTLAKAILNSKPNVDEEAAATQTANNSTTAKTPDNFIDGEIDPETGLAKKKVKSVGLPFSYNLPINNLMSL
ncbi:MAG: hypothetical protein IPK59_08405 [Rhodospirillaceae bacterium]|nr:hypothetical protein [Rhodospirillaceae bacterium]